VSFLRKQESRKNNWLPAFAGMTYKGALRRERTPSFASLPGLAERQASGAQGTGR